MKSPKILLIPAAAAVLLLSACTAGGPEEAGGDADLTWWILQNSDGKPEAAQEMAEAYMADNPGVTVTLETRDNDAHKQSLRQTAGTPAGPDVYFNWAGPGLGGELVKVGASLDLTTYYEEYGWSDRFTAPALGAVKQYGGYHGVPLSQNTITVYYNRALFDAAGIDAVPTSYDELVDAAAKLDASGTTPIAFGGSVSWHLMRWADSLLEETCGADLHDALTHFEADWASEACVEGGFTELKKWTDSYMGAGFMGIDRDEAMQSFLAGQAAMVYEGSWANAEITNAGLNLDDFGVFNMPTGTNRTYDFFEAYYMGSGTENPDEVAKFLDFITSPDQQDKYPGLWTSIPVVNGLAEQTDVPAITNELMTIVKSAEGSYEPGDQVFDLEHTTEYWRIVDSVATGAISPADAGGEFQTFIDNNK